MDGLVGPLAGEAELAPGRDGAAAAMVRGGIDGINLLEGELLERVVRMDEKGDGIEEAEMPVSAARDGCAERGIAEFFREARDVGRLEFARDHHELQVALDELERAQAARVGRRQVEGDLGVIFLEGGDPLLRQRGEHVGRGALEVAAQPDIAAGHIGGQGGIEHRLLRLGHGQLAALLFPPLGLGGGWFAGQRPAGQRRQGAREQGETGGETQRGRHGGIRGWRRRAPRPPTAVSARRLNRRLILS